MENKATEVSFLFLQNVDSKAFHPSNTLHLHELESEITFSSHLF